MGRRLATLWHASFSIGAGVLFFFFVLPRWSELVGDTSETVGTILRIVTGLLIGLAALPVVFTLLRTRKPELGVPQLALSLRTWSIIGHVLAGVLIVGTAISEIWFKLDSAGRWLFAIYGAAAAIAVLAFFAFYLSFIAELPPPPPKPRKVKEPKQRGRDRRKKKKDADEADEFDDLDDTDEAEEADETEEAEEAGETEEAEKVDAATAETVEAEVPDETEAAAETVEAPAPKPVPELEPEPEPKSEPEPESVTEEVSTKETRKPKPADETRALRNRRPSGKTSHRRRRTRGGVAVEE